VVGADREPRKAFVGDPIRKVVGRGDLAEGALDRDLPHAGCADERLVDRIGDRVAGGCRQCGVVGEPPQQRVRVQQQPAHRV